jgi:hypothetical protein
VYASLQTRDSMKVDTMEDFSSPVPSLEEDSGKLRGSTIARAVSHEHPRGSIVLENDLMNNPRARSPEFNPVLFGRAV